MNRLLVLSILWAWGARAQVCMRLSTSNRLAKMLDSQYEPFTRPTVQTGPANHWAVQSTNMRSTAVCEYMRLEPEEIRHLTHTVNVLGFAGVMMSVANDQGGELVEEMVQNFDRALVFSTEPVCKDFPDAKFVQLQPMEAFHSPSVTFKHTTTVPDVPHVYVPNQGFACSPGDPNPAVMCSFSPRDLIPTLYPNLLYSKISNCFHRALTVGQETLADVSVPAGVLSVVAKVKTTIPPPTSPAPTLYTARTTPAAAALNATPDAYQGDSVNDVGSEFEDDSGIFILPAKVTLPPATVRAAAIKATPDAPTDPPIATSTATKAVTRHAVEEEEKPVYSFIKSRGTSVVFQNFICIMCTCLITLFCTYSLY